MINNSKRLLYLLIIGIFFISCSTYKPFYAKSEKDWEKANNPDTLTLSYTVFLTGDAGNSKLKSQEPTLRLLESQLYKIDTVISANKKDTIINKKSDPKDVIIFMGDNIYDNGLPPQDATSRQEKETIILQQLNVVKDFKGRKIFVPGNHDWNDSKKGGLEALKRQEEFIEQNLNKGDTFIPSNGCPGPVELQLNNNLVIIVVDSEWWLHKHEKSAIADGCTAGTREQLLSQIKDILIRNRGKNILFTQHHPLFSNGTHGGYFTLKDYIFPLTLLNKKLYIPLPIIGSLYPLSRQYGISRQDISNKEYQQLRNSLLTLLKEEKNLVFAAGHEHALQFTKQNNFNHIISGAGSKSNAIFKGNDALFGYGTKGFARLNYYTNGQCWVEFWEPIGDGSQGKLVYRKPLYALPATKTSIAQEKAIDYKDSVKTIAIAEELQKSLDQKKILGKQYRNVWATPVKIKYLDLTTYAGGLTPTELNIEKQTYTLNLVGKDNNYYQFKTVNKDPASLLPKGFQTTFAEDFMQDQISSAHPFSSLIVPYLAKASGVYHQNPELVYIPYSRLLGPYISEIGGRIGFMQKNPSRNLTLQKGEDRPSKIISTEELYGELKKDHNNEVDQKSFLKARLLDLIIGDWDKGEKKWQWAAFKNGKGFLYKPIPLSRDKAFTKIDGIIPVFSRSLIPNMQHFDYTIKNPAKLSIAARNLDRNLLNKLSEKDWRAIALEIKQELTDKVIENAVKQMPKEAFSLSGQEIINKLISRKDLIEKTAIKYYQVLAKEVTITGSDKKEIIEVKKSKDSISIKLFKPKEIKPFYSRTFYNELTKEINLYLLAGQDSLVSNGESSTKVKIRIVGGNGQDHLTDQSESNKTVIYDSKENGKEDIRGNQSTRIVLSSQRWVNEYVRDGFNYNKSGFSPAADYPNGLDGPSIGLTHIIKRYGFRKLPYAFEQKTTLLYAPKNGAFEVKYGSIFHSLFAHKYDLIFDGYFSGPAYRTNYYGIGNTTSNNDDVDYYRVRSRYLRASAYMQYRYSNNARFGIGPGIEYMDIMQENRDNFINTTSENISSPDKFVTLKSYLDVDLRDKKISPSSGLRWVSNIDYYKQINNEKYNTVSIASSLSAYATPNLAFPMTFALRIGGITKLGDYNFYQASTLGSIDDNLRGYRNQRFSGRTAYFGNSELRIPVAKIRGYFLAGDIGAFAFYDIGKVNSGALESKKWHKGYGPGVWINLFDYILLTLGYGISEEDQVLTFKTGFRF